MVDIGFAFMGYLVVLRDTQSRVKNGGKCGFTFSYLKVRMARKMRTLSLSP
jgi:hypothetical protein